MNLHNQLADLDFFVMLSSVAGITGHASQANYAAAGTFEDAMAHHRNSMGLPTTSIDLGMILSVGHDVAENPELISTIKSFAAMPVREDEYLSMLKSAMGKESGSLAGAQLISGFDVQAMMDSKSPKNGPFWFRDAKFSHLRQLRPTSTAKIESRPEPMLQGSLANVSSAEMATKFIGTALTKKLSKSPMIPSKDINPSMPLAA